MAERYQIEALTPSGWRSVTAFPDQARAEHALQVVAERRPGVRVRLTVTRPDPATGESALQVLHDSADASQPAADEPPVGQVTYLTGGDDLAAAAADAGRSTARPSLHGAEPPLRARAPRRRGIGGAAFLALLLVLVAGGGAVAYWRHDVLSAELATRIDGWIDATGLGQAAPEPPPQPPSIPDAPVAPAQPPDAPDIPQPPAESQPAADEAASAAEPSTALQPASFQASGPDVPAAPGLAATGTAALGLRGARAGASVVMPPPLAESGDEGGDAGPLAGRWSSPGGCAELGLHYLPGWEYTFVRGELAKAMPVAEYEVDGASGEVLVRYLGGSATRYRVAADGASAEMVDFEVADIGIDPSEPTALEPCPAPPATELPPAGAAGAQMIRDNSPAFGFGMAVGFGDADAALAYIGGELPLEAPLPPQQEATPLEWAVFNGRGRVVDALLAAGAEPNRLGPQGVSPLIVAVLSGKLEMVTRLVEAGADPTLADAAGITPLDHARGRGLTAIAAYLDSAIEAAAADTAEAP